MNKILLVTHIIPRTMSSGGEHRSYQILHDLESVVGQGNVPMFDPRPPAQRSPNANLPLLRMPWRLKHLIKRIGDVRGNVSQVLLETGFSLNKFAYPGRTERYEEVIRQTRPVLCVIQHAACAWMVAINRCNNTPTIACPQNLDSLDQGLPITRRGYLPAVLGDLGSEIRALESCDHKLMISKVETAICEGLGYPSYFYPYRPVGEIKAFFEEIHYHRQNQSQERGLFVLLGSASHKPIRHGMQWFLEQVVRHGLPDPLHVVAVGPGTAQLLPPGKDLPGIKLMGFVEKDILEQLLLRAQGVLLPKFRGFGSVTRLPEMSCAGIPTIASEYVTYGIDTPPQVWVAGHDWDSWLTAMNTLLDAVPIGANEYANWHERQSSSLASIVRSIISEYS